MLHLLWLLLLFAAGAKPISIEEFAVPTAIQAGENAELRCLYKLDDDDSEDMLFVKWWWTPLHKSIDERKLIYQRIAAHKQQIVTVGVDVVDNDTIVLENLQPDRSGSYECEVSSLDEIRQHGELIVYSKGSGPNMTITTVLDTEDSTDPEVDTTKIFISCQADDVAPEPDLTITVNGEVIDTEVWVDGPVDGLYNVSTNTSISEDTINGADIRCELFYKNENISHPAYIDSLKYDTSDNTSVSYRTSLLAFVIVALTFLFL